jgi:uncharacterized protein DUF4058
VPIHDWTRVSAGIFHAFHHEWISEIGRALNRGLLPVEYYALAEQQVAGFGPDILTLQRPDPATAMEEKRPVDGPTGLLLAPPRARFTAETSTEPVQRKRSTIVVRHVSGDRIVAVVEIVSPGNKSSQHAFQALIGKACELLEAKIHLLIIDLFPPTKRDPEGIHAALWESLAGETFAPPVEKPLTLAAYESGDTVKAFIEPVALGDVLPEMPLFLEPGAHILLPLEPTYQAAFASVPVRWQQAL